MAEFHYGDILLGAVLAVLGWAMRGKFVSYDKKHADFYKHSTDTVMHPTAPERHALVAVVEEKFKSHEQLDSERFAQIEKTMDEVRMDIKELLKRSMQ